MTDQKPPDPEVEFVLEHYRIPTREEHRRAIRRIWISCVSFALSIFFIFGGICALILFKNVEPHRAVSYTTIVFQLVIALFATGFTTPYFLETRHNLNVGMDMNRRALQIGTKTAENLEKMESRFDPLVERIEKLLTKAEDFVEKNGEDGKNKIDRLIAALEKLAAKAEADAGSVLEETLKEAWEEPEAKQDAPVDGSAS